VTKPSNDAMAVLGTVFQHGMKLTFQLVENQPTKRAQAALDELVAAEMIVREDLPERADGTFGVQYKARVPTEKYRRYAHLGKGLILAEPRT
jgi:hypothetical protein